MPKLTHLQFLILRNLWGRTSPGHWLRDLLEREWPQLLSDPAFYQLMARLEDSGWATGEYRTRQVGERTIKERWYRITPEGKAEVKTVAEFYRKRAK